MRAIRGWACVLAAGLALSGPLGGADPSLNQVLSSIELRYNKLATLRIDFEQTLSYFGRQPRVERGTLSLRRPQMMHWDYSTPEGKLLVGDGDLLHLYDPLTNQVRRVDLTRATDLRAPLAFLLGRLNFRRQFRNLGFEDIGGRRVLVGEGQPGRDPYGRVEFTYDPATYRIEHIRVVGQDEAVTTFAFRNETVNLPLDTSLFTFEAPPGAQMMDESPERGGQ